VNVSFLAPTMRTEFGGCAGNIAYNLKMLGGDPRIVGVMGQDNAAYMERFRKLGWPPTTS
jgi:adenosine kinase